MHDLRPSSGGALTIAAALSICTYLLPDVLKRFQAAHPKTMITVRSGHSKEVLEMVLAGEAELGLARSLQHPEIETVSLRDDPLVLVATPGSPMARAGRARLDEIAAQPLILFDRGSSDWTLTLGLFRRAGLVPNVVLEVESIEAAKRMVERGIGIAFLPQLAVVREIRRGQLIAIDLRDAEALSRSLDVIHPRQRPLSTEAQRAAQDAAGAAVGEVAPPARSDGAPARDRPAAPARAAHLRRDVSAAGAGGREAISPAIAASARPSAMPPSTSEGQCARRTTRARPTSTIIVTASTRAARHSRGDSASARKITAPQKAAAAVECPLGNPNDRSSGRARPHQVLERPLHDRRGHHQRAPQPPLTAGFREDQEHHQHAGRQDPPVAGPVHHPHRIHHGRGRQPQNRFAQRGVGGHGAAA